MAQFSVEPQAPRLKAIYLKVGSMDINGTYFQVNVFWSGAGDTERPLKITPVKFNRYKNRTQYLI